MNTLLYAVANKDGDSTLDQQEWILRLYHSKDIQKEYLEIKDDIIRYHKRNLQIHQNTYNMLFAGLKIEIKDPVEYQAICMKYQKDLLDYKNEKNIILEKNLQNIDYIKEKVIILKRKIKMVNFLNNILLLMLIIFIGLAIDIYFRKFPICTFIIVFVCDWYKTNKNMSTYTQIKNNQAILDKYNELIQ